MADDIVLNEHDRMDFWSFVEAPHAKTELKISTIYLSIGKNLLNEYPKKVSEFIADAHSRGIRVEYLTGDPRWALSEIDPCSYEEDGSRINGCEEEAEDTPFNQPSFDELNDLLAYNGNVQENERFDGYHQDTEPYALGNRFDDPLDWSNDTQRNIIWAQFVATTATWKSMIVDHNTEKGDDLIIGSAIPFWLDMGDGSGSDTPSHQAIQNIVDYISVMNYNTRLSNPSDPEIQGFSKTVESEISYASTIGKAVYVGVETIEFNYKASVNSFFRNCILQLLPISTDVTEARVCLELKVWHKMLISWKTSSRTHPLTEELPFITMRILKMAIAPCAPWDMKFTNALLRSG